MVRMTCAQAKSAKIKIKTGKASSENAPPGEPKAVLKLKIKSEPSVGADKPAAPAPSGGGAGGASSLGKRPKEAAVGESPAKKARPAGATPAGKGGGAAVAGAAKPVVVKTEAVAGPTETEVRPERESVLVNVIYI